MNKPSSTNALTQGAASAAIYLVLLLIVVYIPLINMIVFFFLPLPFIVHMFRHGLKSTALVGGASLFLTAIVAPLPALFITVTAASVGVVMGYFYSKGKGALAPIMAGMITYLGNYLLALMISYFVFDINLIEAMKQQTLDMIKLTEEAAGKFQIPVDEEILAVYKEFIPWIGYIFPAVMIMSSVVMVGLHHMVSRPVLSRLGHSIPKLPPLREWQFPRSILFYYLVTLMLVLLGFMEEGSTIFLIIVNLHPILELLLFIQGLSVIAYFAYSKKIGKALIIMSVVLIILFPFMTFIVRMLGIFEIGFGLKSRIKPQQ